MHQSYSKGNLSGNPAAAYRQNSILTATPERLVVMVYDGLLRYLNQAKASLEYGREHDVSGCLGRAQDIITELIVSLDPQCEISVYLHALYDYIYRQLIAANLRRDPAVVQEVEELVKGLREAWSEAVERNAVDRRRFTGERVVGGHGQ